MIDTRALQYFVVSADAKSFSQAARILFTTQSNISKSIASLENSLGVSLFVRDSRGLTLTSQGENMYRYATRILDEMEEMERISTHAGSDWLNISGNPSSWFSRRFVEFYNLHYEEDLHFQIRNAGTSEVLKRVRDYKDELGFLYVFPQQEKTFQYNLERHHLEFIQMAAFGGTLYLGRDHPGYGRGRLTEKELSELRLVQMYENEYTRQKDWTFQNDASRNLNNADVAVITNSDYIMQAFLKGSQLGNISGAPHPDPDPFIRDPAAEVPLNDENGKAAYGYVKRKGEPLTELAGRFISFIQRALLPKDTV